MEPKNEAAALTPERIEKLKAHLENNAFAQICGIKVAEMRYDYVKMTAEVRPELLNPLGRVHGGMLYTLADCCSGLTARGWPQIRDPERQFELPVQRCTGASRSRKPGHPPRPHRLRAGHCGALPRGKQAAGRGHLYDVRHLIP